ncbi:hypothetical protein L9F63_026354, partial [Diploptera punctata]
MSNSRRRCAALNCPGTATLTHRFPKDFVRCQIWAERAGCLHLLKKGVEVMNSNYRLCSDHFSDNSYTSTERKRLSNFALPEIFSRHSGLYGRRVTKHLCHEDSNKCSVDTLCRTCARVCEDLIPVFSDKGLEMQLVEKIHTHLPIMVTREDVLPLAICLSCVEKLETCNEFVHCSLQADAMLRSILSLQTALEIEDEENKKPADIEIKEQQSSSNELKKKQDVIEPVENEINSDKCITTVEQYGTESKINSINPKFKVVVMKMKNAKNLSSDAQMEKALNMLKNLDSAPVSCTLRYLLKEHMNVHTNVRPYKCSHCVKSFHKRCQLRQHVVIHLNTRQHKCPVCGKGFNRLGNMKAHARRHLNSNCYTCKLCKTTFSSFSEIIQHRKSHKHKDPEQSMKQQAHQNENVCILCGQNFNQKDDLDIHFETFHTTDIIVASNTLMINSDTLVALPGIMEDDQKSFEYKYIFRNFIGIIYSMVY